MKAAILADNNDSFIKPMAEGLDRMLKHIGVNSFILYNGLASLPRPVAEDKNLHRNWKEYGHHVLGKALSYVSYRHLVKHLCSVDFAAIIGHVPGPYMENFFDHTRLRFDLPELPLILYDLVYLPTRGQWARWILENDERVGGDKTRQNYGLNRYDYHLCVTEVSENPVPTGAENFSRIGINLVDPSLAVVPKKEFVALIDFERPEHLHERAIQVLACVEAGVPFQVLHGHYAMNDIRKIYRNCNVYFVAHRESFGLPICELQACGAKIFTPYTHWCPSHYVTMPDNGNGMLPANFIVYDNDKDRLVHELKQLKSEFNAKENLINFQRDQSDFYYGNIDELAKVVGLIKDGIIHAHSHDLYPTLDQLVEAIEGCKH